MTLRLELIIIVDIYISLFVPLILPFCYVGVYHKEVIVIRFDHSFGLVAW